MNKGTKCTFLPNAVPTVRTDNWTWASVARTKAHTAPPAHARRLTVCGSPRSDPEPALRGVSAQTEDRRLDTARKS